MTFDAGTIEASLELNRTPFQRGLDEAEAEGANFERKTFKANLDVETGTADAKAAETGAIYDVLRENLQRRMSLDVSTDEADAKAAETAGIYEILRANLERTIHIKADVDRGGILGKLLGGAGGGAGNILNKLLGGLGGAGGSTNIGKVLSGNFDQVGTSVTGLVGIIIAAFPLIAASIGPVVTLVGGLSAGFVAAGASLTGFAALAYPLMSKLIKDHQALALAQQQYARATTSTQRQTALRAEAAATSNLTGAEKGLFGTLQQIISLYNKLQTAFAKPIAQALGPWLTGVREIFKLLPELVRPVIPIIEGLGRTFDSLLKESGFRQFFKELGTFGAFALKEFVLSLFNLIEGFTGLMQAFFPVGRILLPDLVKLTEQFAQWGTSVGKTRGFHEFITESIKLLPTLGSLLSSLLIITVKLIEAFAPLGVIMLRVIAWIARFLASLSPNDILLIVAAIGLLTGGWVLLAAAIMAIIGLVVNNWPKITKVWRESAHETAVIFDGVRHYIASCWDAVWNNTIGRMQRGQQDMFRLGNQMRHEIANIWDGMRHEVAHLWDEYWNNVWVREYNGVRDLLGYLGQFRHWVANTFDNIRHDISTIWSDAWNDVKRACVAPVNWVITHVIDGLIHAFDWISGKVGGPQIKPLAAIGMTTGGRLPGYGGGDRIPALLERGESVVSKEMTSQHAAELRAWGVPGFQTGGMALHTGTGLGGPLGNQRGTNRHGGGIFGDIWHGITGAVSHAFHAVEDIGKITAAVFSGNTVALTNDIRNMLPGGLGGATAEMAGLLESTITTLIKDAVKELIGVGSAMGGATANEIIKYAMSFIGKVPYVWGGTTPAGWDCSGFTSYIYKHFGYGTIPRTSEEQFGWVRHTGLPVPGGLAFFAGSDGTKASPGHVGIVINGQKIVDAYGTGFGTRINNIYGDSGAVSGFGVPPGGFGGKSGPANLRQIEGWWMQGGGPGGMTAHIAAAITGAESGFNPRAIQQGQPYATTGWGLWQITPGNSEPQYGINDALLIPINNARAAVAKWKGAGDSFSPWTTFMSGAYRHFMDAGGPLPPGTHLTTNATGRNEEVLTPLERAAFVSLAKQAAAGGFGRSLIGEYHAHTYGSGDMAAAMSELLFTLRHAELEAVTP